MEEITLSGRLPDRQDAFPPASMNRFRYKSIKPAMVVEILSYLFIVLFVYAALRKFLDLAMFSKELTRLRFLKQSSKGIIITISTIEIIVAILLAITRTRLLGLFCTFSLFVLYTIYLLFLLEYTKVIPPHFGEIIDYVTLPEYLFGNIILSYLGFITLNIQLRLKNNRRT
jgi:hypothetical protein